ncbi:MAG: ATP-binding cassette domain-containing protein [Azospirillum sp.]|nr:ATP-binding cassette domain-containing protein [Azospirillum sp.]
MIVVRNLVFDYPTKRALRAVSFDIQAGTITGLVGPNGAGKTTLLRCLAGLETPVSGSISIERIDVTERPREAHRRLGLLQDVLGLYDDLTGRQGLMYQAAAFGIGPRERQKRVMEVVTRLGIADRLDDKIGTLSRGLRQRIAIAQSILHRPKVLLLDEPASGLDPDARTALSELLRTLGQEGMTLIVSSHILAELEDYTTHMIILRNGRVVEHCPTRAPAGKPRRLKLSLAQGSTNLKPALLADAAVAALDVDAHGQWARFDFSGDIAAQAQFLQSLIASGLPIAALQEEARSMQSVYTEKMRGPKR